MMKSVVMSVMLGLGSMGIFGMDKEETSVQDEGNKEIELFYMYDVEHGTYWLDPMTEEENVIWVDDESLEAWGISKRDLHHGNKFMGLFDSEGWELEGLKEIE